MRFNPFSVLPSGLLSAAKSVNWRPRRDRRKESLVKRKPRDNAWSSLSLSLSRWLDGDLLLVYPVHARVHPIDCNVKAAVQKCATSFLLKAVPCEAHNRVSLMMYYYDGAAA